MDNIKIVSMNENLHNEELEVAKKLKVRPTDYQNVIDMKKANLRVVVQEPEISKPVMEPIEEKTLKVKEEPIIEKKIDFEPNPTFEEPVYNNFEQNLKNLDAVWKDPKPERVKPEMPEENKKHVTTKDFESIIYSKFYSEQAKAYFAPIISEYEEICKKERAKAEMIRETANRYNKELEIGSKMDEVMKREQSIMEKLNALDVDFLKSDKDEESKNVLLSMNKKFEKSKTAYVEASGMKEESIHRKNELNREDEKVKSEYAKILESKDLFASSKYETAFEVKRKDDNLREAAEELTETTGIHEEPVKTNDITDKKNFEIRNDFDIQNSRTTVSKIENIAERRNTIDIPNYNHFDSVRDEEISFRRVA